MDVPYNKDGNYHEFIKKVRDYTRDLREYDYMLVLSFINDLHLKPFSIKSLTDIRNFENRLLAKNIEDKKTTIINYSERLKKELGLRTKINSNTDPDDIDEKYVISFIKRTLSRIGYKLTVKKYTFSVTKII